jgi:hypothetical protein
VPDLLRQGVIKLSDVKEFNAWRAKTSLLISRRVDKQVVDQKIDLVLHHLITRLDPFIGSLTKMVRSELRDIICKAVELSEEISKTRAILSFNKFNINDVEYGFPFEDHCMESDPGLEEAAPGMNVELIVSPCFSKAGTADGDAYESQSLLGKCAVVCTENRKSLGRV